MKHICFYFYQVGGFNALAPLVGNLMSSYRVSVFSSRTVAQYAMKTSFPFEIRLLHDSCADLFNVFPSFLITDSTQIKTSFEAFLFSTLWGGAQKKSIPVLVYIDCWFAYLDRFQFQGDRLPLPNVVALIDQVASDEFDCEMPFFIKKKFWGVPVLNVWQNVKSF